MQENFVIEFNPMENVHFKGASTPNYDGKYCCERYMHNLYNLNHDINAFHKHNIWVKVCKKVQDLKMYE